MIYAIRTTIGRENIVMNNLINKIKNAGLQIYSIYKPNELKGYIFIEGEIEDIETVISGVPHIRGLIKKPIPLEELKKFLEIRKAEIKLSIGDIIEITGGPFKNEKGKVTRIDKNKEEVTVELLEAAIPIPVTVPVNSVRLLKSAESEK